MSSISLCMIVKNEEDMIGACLESVYKAVDEIIIVDTGSTDQTREIVKKYTSKLYEFKWVNDFSAARNYSFSKATKDYILWLDADDILKPEDAKKLIELKQKLNDSIDYVTFVYHYAFDEEGKPSLVFRRERLVKRNRGFQWVGFIHEFIATEGNNIDADINVTHTRVHSNPDRNIKIYEAKIAEGQKLSVRDKYYYGKELYYHGKLEETIQVLEEFVKLPCWVEDQVDALYRIADCYQWQGKYQKARETLYQSFEVLLPRAEGLFRIGKNFQEEKKYEQAIYWYEMIFHTKKPKEVQGFLFSEFWTWKPHLELCVCYYQIGEVEKSIHHNEEAAKFVPNNEAVKFNREYFASQEK